MRTPLPHRSTTALRGLLCATTLAVLVGCTPGISAPDPDSSDPSDAPESASPSETTTAKPDPVVVTTKPAADSHQVPVSQTVSVAAEGGTLASVKVSADGHRVDGEWNDDHTRWRATDRLEPGLTYQVVSVSKREDGHRVTRTSRFDTEPLTLDQQTYPTVAPLADETVGVGMPVVVTFDIPVTNKAVFERHMSVTTKPEQKGTWHWLSDNEVHYRPVRYWEPGTKVSVDVDVNGLPAGNGIYGQESRQVDFEVGDANIFKVDAASHQMQVYSNGDLLRTIPITTGKPGFTTRSGIKVIIEKFDSKRMNSETVGISQDDPEAYDIDNVQWAMRVTYSGEFIHAAPWSVGSQGYANVSHGCTGLSTDNAGWLYSIAKRGDVVEYTGTDRPMEPGNGYGDWNVPWKEYVKGSALH